MFLQSAFLIGLAAVLVPIVVHLLSRQQILRVPLGTTRFLMEVITDNSRKRKIRRWLLLLTRMAVAALLALLFARPFLPTYEDMLGGALRIVLIDRSASMQAPGQNGQAIDEALTMARSEIDRLGKNKTVLWAAFDSHVEPIATTPGAQPKVTVRPTGDTNFDAALAWARDRLAAEKHTNVEVLLFTDLQMTGLATQRSPGTQHSPGTELLPASAPVRVFDVGRREVQNVAIQAIEKRIQTGDAHAGLAIAASVFNYGNMPAEDVPATAVITNGQRTLRLKKTLDIAASQASEALFDFGVVEPGLWQVTIDIDAADDLAFDNRRLAAFEVNQPDRILVIDSSRTGPTRGVHSFFLNIALQAAVKPETPAPSADATSGNTSSNTIDEATPGLFDVSPWYLDDQGPPLLQQDAPELVVVANAALLSARLVSSLEDYVEQGGRLLVFAGHALDPAALAAWQASALTPGKLLQSESAAAMPFRITDISSASSMLAPFLDPQQGDLSRLAFTTLLSVDIAQPERVLARFDGTRPAITEHAVGSGRVAWFMASADDSSGSWTTSPLYLPLVRQMAADLLGRTGEGPIRYRHVGDPLPSQPQPPSKPAQGSSSASPAKAEPVATGPTDHLFFEQTGFVRISESANMRDKTLYVVNPAIKESDPTRVDVETLATQLGIRVAADENHDRQVESQASFYELWPYLVCALLTLLVLEYFLSNRTSA